MPSFLDDDDRRLQDTIDEWRQGAAETIVEELLPEMAVLGQEIQEIGGQPVGPGTQIGEQDPVDPLEARHAQIEEALVGHHADLVGKPLEAVHRSTLLRRREEGLLNSSHREVPNVRQPLPSASVSAFDHGGEIGCWSVDDVEM